MALLAARARPAVAGAPRSPLVRTGRALEHLPAVAAGFADGQVTAEQVAVIAPVAAPENLGRAAAQGVDLAEVDAVLAEHRGHHRSTSSCAGRCTTTWPTSTPTAPNPTPPRAGR